VISRVRHCAIVGDGCAGPPYPSMRIGLGAIGLADGLPGAFARVLGMDLGSADATTEQELARLVLMGDQERTYPFSVSFFHIERTANGPASH
jgi:hypothetical protein